MELLFKVIIPMIIVVSLLAYGIYKRFDQIEAVFINKPNKSITLTTEFIHHHYKNYPIFTGVLLMELINQNFNTTYSIMEVLQAINYHFEGGKNLSLLDSEIHKIFSGGIPTDES